MTSPLYRDYAAFLGELFPGMKVQKIAINAGLSCPNRDGTKGRGGCTYCNNDAFNPPYCRPSLPPGRQIELGREFFARKYPTMKYLAYFQAYTSTNAAVNTLMPLYSEALGADDVVGLIIGTRPDCIPDTLLDRLAALRAATGKKIIVEFGAESSHDATLSRVNRCHTWADTVDAVERTAAAGLDGTGLHLIMGLPGEDRHMMLETIDRVNTLPIDTVKIHQLQLVKSTRLAADVEAGKCDITRFSAEEYIELCCDIVARLRPDIAIERFVSQSPAELLIYPRWGLKNYQFTALLQKRLKALGRCSNPLNNNRWNEKSV